MKEYKLAVTLMLLASCIGLSAQDGSVYERGATYLENTMPPSPNPASLVKYADVPFMHSTGMAEYDIPFYTLQGRELSIPIGLHYASGGIKLEEIAGVAGLGWNLQAGGCITRTVKDMPDEYVPLTGPFRHEVPSGDFLTELENMVENDATRSFLLDLVWNRIDSGLDHYCYNVCGLSGTFVIHDDGLVYQLSGSGVVIGYSRADDGSVDEFTITGPDGTVYTLSLKEMASRDGRGMESIGPMNGKLDEWTAPTAWHLTRVRSRSGLETAEFTYSEPAKWDRSVRTVIETMTYNTGEEIVTSKRSVSSRNVTSVYETRVLTGITLNGQTVSFEYGRVTGSHTYSGSSSSQQNFPFCLEQMSLHISGNPSEVCMMKVNTASAAYDGRIILNGLELYRDGKLDDKWDFTYKGVGRSVSRGSQDWYGYYNGENEFSDSGRTILCPYEFSSEGRNINLVKGHPNPDYADYMSLVSVNNDGAETQFVYEGNSFNASFGPSSIGVRVQKIVLTGEGLRPARVRYFGYESPGFTGESEPTPDMYCTSQIQVIGLAMGAAAYSCQLALHDSPVSLGPSIRDTRVYYRRVCEDVALPPFAIMVGDKPDTNTSRTVYEYDLSDIRPYGNDTYSRFPDAFDSMYAEDFNAFIPALSSGVRKGYEGTGPAGMPLLKRKEEYAYENGNYRLVSSLDCVYDAIPRGVVIVDYYATQVYHGYVTTAPDFHEIYHFPIYAGCKYERRPIKEIYVGYHPSGNDTTVVNTSYVSRPSLETPLRDSTVSRTEGGAYRRMEYRYADNWPNDRYATMKLKEQHCLSTPIWRGMVYENRDVIALPDTLFPVSPLNLDKDPVPSPIKPSLPSVKADMEELVNYGWFSIKGENYLLPSSHVEYHLGNESWREDVLSRDTNGNITSVKEKGQPETVILWGYSGRLPVAVIRNATLEQVQTAYGDRPSAMEGAALSPVPPQVYLDKVAGLRAALPQAHITTYTHIPGVGVESITDPAGLVTSFEYDAGKLVCVRDNEGHKIEEYEYSLMSDDEGRRHMHSRVFRSADGQRFAEDVNWWDVFGRKIQSIAKGASGTGADLVTAYESDFMFHDDVKTWLPFPVHNTQGQFQTDAASAAQDYHGNPLAYMFRNYELSARDRVVSEALPGYAGEHETAFETDVPAFMGEYPVMLPIYEWKDAQVERAGWYASDELVVEKTIDTDGRVVTICRDHFGKIIYTSVGNNDLTHYVYDLYDRLRAVKGSGIDVTDTLNMWRYDYDSLGRMSSKGIPGSVREYYTYNDEDRVIAILRDGVLKEMEYDAFGRVLRTYLTRPGSARVLMEENTYDSYPENIQMGPSQGQKTSARLAELDSDGNVTGYADVVYQYDTRLCPVMIVTTYGDGSVLRQDISYTFAGEVKSIRYVYSHEGEADEFSLSNIYDGRGRIKSESALLTPSQGGAVRAGAGYSYDDTGRLSHRNVAQDGGTVLATEIGYSLQGWQTRLSVVLNESPLFEQTLGYDGEIALASYVPQYSGMVSLKDEKWYSMSGDAVANQEWYRYDYAGRLGVEFRPQSRTTYTYDARGNVLSVGELPSRHISRYSYDGDKLDSLKVIKGIDTRLARFAYDNLGRMTYDGLTGQTMTYNDLDLLGKVEKDGSTLANYSYLSDGTKLSATDGNGKGLVYRGPFVYRKSSGSSSLKLESAAYSGGRVTPGRALLYVTDYLGNVRAVVDGSTGAIYKVSDYSTFGEESQVISLQTSLVPVGITLRDGYTGQENQNLNFGTSYIDFGARQYSPTLRRWMMPDPLSEKYYGISPYTFCNNNPVNFVDPDGEFPLLSNFAGAFVSAGVEYGSQVIGNIFSRGFSVDVFTDVDLFDIGVAFGEGFITSGTNVARKIVTKSAIGLAGEVARNALDVEFKDGEVQTPVLNSFGKVLTDTAIGVASEAISVDVNITPFNGVSNTQAVRAARETAGARGASLSSEAADGIRKSNATINAEKSAANKAVSNGIGSVPGSVASEVIDNIQEKYID